MKRLAALPIFCFVFLFLLPTAARAANFYLEPASGAYNVGNEFNIAVWVDDPSGDKIQTMDIIMSYDKTTLSTSKSKIKDELYFDGFGTSVFNVDEAAGKLSLYVFSTQGTYSRNTKGKVLTITFKAKAGGTATVNFICGDEFGSAIRNSADTEKNLIVCGANGSGSYTLAESATPLPPTSTPIPTAASIPPTPTPTSVPSGGVTPASTPTSAPTSVPTSAPTSVLTSGGATSTPSLTGIPQTGFPLGSLGIYFGGALIGLGLMVLLF